MLVKLTISDYWSMGATMLEAVAETGESLSKVQRVYAALNAENPHNINVG